MQDKDGKSKNDYISSKVNDLVSKIGDEYGEILLEELFKRIDNTINHFNSEVKELFVNLKKDEEKKQSVIGLMRKGKQVIKSSDNSQELLNEWEIKLAEMENGKDHNAK